MFYDSPLYFCLLVNFSVLSSSIFGVLVFLFTSNVVLGKVFTVINFTLGAERSSGRNCPLLKFIFNQSLTTGQVPGDWKCASGSPVFKKGSEKDACNYRPVSPTSVLCRIMAHIISHHIMGHLYAHHALVN